MICRQGLPEKAPTRRGWAHPAEGLEPAPAGADAKKRARVKQHHSTAEEPEAILQRTCTLVSTRISPFDELCACAQGYSTECFRHLWHLQFLDVSVCQRCWSCFLYYELLHHEFLHSLITSSCTLAPAAPSAPLTPSAPAGSRLLTSYVLALKVIVQNAFGTYDTFNSSM